MRARNYETDAQVRPNSFAGLLHAYRERAKIPRSRLSHAIGMDGSYLVRLEWDERPPPHRGIVDALVRELRLHGAELDAFVAAAGYVPPAAERLGGWDALLSDVAGVLTDDRLSEDERQQFRAVVSAIAAQWRGKVRAGGHVVTEQAYRQRMGVD